MTKSRGCYKPHFYFVKKFPTHGHFIQNQRNNLFNNKIVNTFKDFLLSFSFPPVNPSSLHCSSLILTIPATPLTGKGLPTVSSLRPTCSRPGTPPDPVGVTRNSRTSRAPGSRVRCQFVEPPRCRPSPA